MGCDWGMMGKRCWRGGVEWEGVGRGGKGKKGGSDKRGGMENYLTYGKLLKPEGGDQSY